MNFLFILICILCLCLGWLYLRLWGDIRSLRGQLEEIQRGSHMELAANSRQRCLVAFCRTLNQVLLSKDAEHMRYERAERQLKQNIINLAHDIRTPLTGAAGYVQLALECEVSEKQIHYLSMAQNRLGELEDMLEKLFLYTKLTGGEFSFPTESMKNIQVLPFLGECLISLYARFEQTKTSPEVLFESQSFQVYAEEEALRRIFLNLIQNALLHGSGGLRILQDNGTSCLIFENPVPENAAIDTAQMFDRFYKADPARGKSSSGLGLFIVRELMRKMGGDAQAELACGRLRIFLYFAPSGPCSPDADSNVSHQ